MATRRQQKVSREVKQIVSEAIRDHISDPRMKGLVSVTRVELSPDLRNAEVFVSIFGCDENEQKATFQVVKNARKHLQLFVGNQLQTKFCPVLRFSMDEEFKKTMETMNVIEQAIRDTERNQTDVTESQ